jgi:hypothetical protein
MHSPGLTLLVGNGERFLFDQVHVATSLGVMVGSQVIRGRVISYNTIPKSQGMRGGRRPARAFLCAAP